MLVAGGTELALRSCSTGRSGRGDEGTNKVFFSRDTCSSEAPLRTDWSTGALDAAGAETLLLPGGLLVRFGKGSRRERWARPKA